MERQLAGRVAVVTGAGRGIGRAIAHTLAEMGAAVVVNDLGTSTAGVGSDSTPADQVVAEIKARGGRAIANYESVAEFEGARRIIEAAVKTFGKIDILVNNAGTSTGAPIHELKPETFASVVGVHLFGTFNCTRHACEHMKRQRWGRIVNLVSRAALIGSTGTAPYGAGKGGIFGFTNVVSRDLAPYGITVNAVNPDAANTRMVTESRARWAATGATAAQSQRMGKEPQDPAKIAVAVGALCTEEAAKINGQFFLVQGSHVGLFQPLTITKHLFKEGKWSLEELVKAMGTMEIAQGPTTYS
ncbi:MAG: SDR family NAD(P)-dependent oxidoreductase [Chloroflexi bacterium]|nr:SDR family NAD(P)-dependent oxidoreductase [Chloroflexota bacterium]